MNLEKAVKVWLLLVQNLLKKISKLQVIRMLFKSRDEKRIFGIMNFQKKSRNGNEKRIFKII